MDELIKNRDSYNSMREKLESKHSGRVALFSDGRLVEIYNDMLDAYLVGVEKFGEGNFSIKQIGQEPASLGAATLFTETVKVG